LSTPAAGFRRLLSVFGFELLPSPLLVLPAREQEVGGAPTHLLKFASDTRRIG